MKPSTVRTGCAAVFVAAVAIQVPLFAFKVDPPVPQIAAAILAAMAVFVAMTSPRCPS